ncbi:ABC transporter permease [Solirubrobacter phytolaccae]|uniref:ABC transporter permease n=1 Tax=Solirubrobacter phytolaccae TaxID=1404360 RepID=A0A9X3N6S7_9ACTN|nr:ABC transporter permease [Solirubrobacter phytolaccae]MDA0180526.1 ABC transporter permease [Solirubrobacter phytolaccae]
MSTTDQPAPIQVGASQGIERHILRYGLLALFAGVTLFFVLSEPSFRSFNNIVSILQSVSIVGIIGLGVTVSMVVGGFDLSIGANAGFTVMLCAICLVMFAWPTVAVVPVALLGGLLIGALNGALIVRLKVPDLLATLGMLFVLQGVQLLPSQGQSISSGLVLDGKEYDGIFTEAFLYIGRGRVFGEIPFPIILFAVCAIALYVVLEKTRWGRQLYAVGGNLEAARLAGIRVDRVRMIAYIVSGVLASLGGIILAARIGEGDVGAGSPFLLDAVAAALVGYAVLAVNRPNILGTTIGAVFLGIMLNGLTIKNFPYYTQDFVKGVVLMVALLLTFGVRRLR